MKIHVFSGTTVGLIVRGKKDSAHEPDLTDQHADCILSDGAPVGFFGEGNDGSSNGSGLGMNGVVYDYSKLMKHRAYYVDANTAKGYGIVSTYLIIPVANDQAKRFDEAWQAMRKAPGSFNILGDNCSTHASDAFIASGILSGGIPGLDTPNNLYNQLAYQYGGKAEGGSGYLGFVMRGSGYDLVVAPA